MLDKIIEISNKMDTFIEKNLKMLVGQYVNIDLLKDKDKIFRELKKKGLRYTCYVSNENNITIKHYCIQSISDKRILSSFSVKINTSLRNVDEKNLFEISSIIKGI